jgi:hypothetical protein
MAAMEKVFVAAAAPVLALVAGCATVHDRYQLYLDASRQAEADLAAQRAAIASAAAACRDDRCVEHVAALAALAVVADRSGASGLAPPPREPTVAEQAAQVIAAVAPIATAVVGYRSTRHATRAATDQHRVTWETVGDIVRSGWDAMGAVADAAAPRYTIGGDMIGGDRVEIGDHYTGGSRSELTVGRDYTHGDRVEVGGDQVGGDQQVGDRAGRDIVRGSPIRWYSPDDRSGDCRDGADCRQYPPPEDGSGP